jgi:fructose-1,6-bisphosphatase I
VVEQGITLVRHVLTKQVTSVPTHDLALIMERIQFVAKRIARQIEVASLAGVLGYTGGENVQGEKVKKLDKWGNDVVIEAFEHCYPVCSLISEEMDEARHYPANCRGTSYCVLCDPIDGSSNIDVDGPIATCFALRRRAPGHGASVDDVLTAGTLQLAAGYILYGPSTQLVFTAGAGVDIYTLDRGLGEFILWRENVRMPPFGSTYAVNQANASKWYPGAQALFAYLTSRKDKRTSYSLRYAGTLAADFHRCLLEGGFYAYPGEAALGGKSKLRLMYELAPLAMIAEQAGGRASTGKMRILDVVPKGIHERHPVYIGSAEEIALAESMKVEG